MLPDGLKVTMNNVAKSSKDTKANRRWEYDEV